MIVNYGTTLTLDTDYKNMVQRVLIVAAMPYKSFNKFAKAIGVTRQAVNYWFKTKHVPILSARKVSALTGISELLLSPKHFLKNDIDNINNRIRVAIVKGKFSQEDEDYLMSIPPPTLSDYKSKK